MVIIRQMARTEVKIAELKSGLSAYLRSVRLGGEVIVKDRETPIARLVPYETRENRLATRPATRPLKHIDKLLDARRRGPRMKPGILEKAFRDSRQDWFDKWLASGPTSTLR